ncbi:hypothetical protein FRC07_010841 [Ceratobasidium sp. 392]|nr:hypothetical protein FRC07_010841 [Ceratobasidium sp. 392]
MRVSFAVLALAAVASASSVFRRQSMPACAMQCIMTADTGSCDATDNTCLCKSDPFIQATYKCISSTCQGDDLASANDAARALCAAAGVTLTQSDPGATETGAPESTPAETSAAETSAAAPTGSAPAGSSSALATGSSPATGSASHTSAAAPTTRATGSATGSAAPTGSSPASNGAVGPAGVSGMVGVLAAVAGFMFAL